MGAQRREAGRERQVGRWRLAASPRPTRQRCWRRPGVRGHTAISLLVQGERGVPGRKGVKGQKGEPGPPGLDQPCPVVRVEEVGGPYQGLCCLLPASSLSSELSCTSQRPHWPGLGCLHCRGHHHRHSSCRGSSCCGLTPLWVQLGRPTPSVERGAQSGAEPLTGCCPSLLCFLTRKGGWGRPSLSGRLSHPEGGSVRGTARAVPRLSSTCPRPLPSLPPYPPMARPAQCLEWPKFGSVFLEGRGSYASDSFGGLGTDRENKTVELPS